MEKGEARVSEPPSNTKEKENERLKEERELRWELERMMKAPTDGSEYVIYAMNIVLLIYWYIFMQRHYMFTKWTTENSSDWASLCQKNFSQFESSFIRK